MSEVDNFIAAIKEKRNEAVEHFLSEDFHQALANGLQTPETVVQKGVDNLIAGMLGVIEEQYSHIITAEVDDDGEILVTCTSDLSTLYFEQVNT